MNLAPFFIGRGIRAQVVEIAKEKFRDEATLRLARIANGAEPQYVNGSPKGRLTRARR